jgi:hypothetical protein
LARSFCVRGPLASAAMSEPPRYHVELKSFPHVARIFNLDRATLDRRFLEPFVAGETIEHDDHRWAADRTKLTVYAGEPVSDGSRGLGRGWGEVTRRGQEVTAAVLAEIHRGADARPEVEALKAAIAEVAAGSEGIELPDAVALAGAAQPGWRASEQLALAEQAVWEMLHQGRLELLTAGGAPITPDGWQAIVLSWERWTASGGDAARLRGLPEAV